MKTSAMAVAESSPSGSYQADIQFIIPNTAAAAIRGSRSRKLPSRIEAARFLAYGCPPTLVCGSALAEMIEGMTTNEAMKLTRHQIVDTLAGLSPQKQHAAALAIETLQAAIEIADR